MGAYNELYLSDAITLIEDLFQEVSEQDKWDFEVFTRGFLNCKFGQLLSEGSARVINMSYDELFEYIECDTDGVLVPGECLIDPLLASWIGGMYVRVQFYSCKTFPEIYERLPLERMVQIFRPLHTIDEELAAEKIVEGLNKIT